MSNKQLYLESSLKISKLVTNKYSTSFSLGIMLVDKSIREHIYAIYGFVRLADEIVDTFHDKDQSKLLEEFKSETYLALSRGISMNPVLHSFQYSVNKFSIDRELIDTFLKSMEMDLKKIEYDKERYQEYILGSAEVVGLMCLKVFCQGDSKLYDRLKPYAMSLGSAFQKINFLRDLSNDMNELGRVYFPNVEFGKITDKQKRDIESEIKKEFDDALEGIKLLPTSSKYGVYTAYLYYLGLLKKIKNNNPENLLEQRIRISNFNKILLLLISYINIKLKRV